MRSLHNIQFPPMPKELDAIFDFDPFHAAQVGSCYQFLPPFAAILLQRDMVEAYRDNN